MPKWFRMIEQNVKKTILSNPKAEYFRLCFRRSSDPDFVKKVINLDRDPDLVRFEHYGSLNPQKIVYLLRIDEHSKGFFALLGLVLDGIRYAERMSFTPVVEWGVHTVVYDESIQATSNPFEYYFEPVSDISVAEANESANVVHYHTIHRNTNAQQRYQTTIGYTYAGNLERYIAQQAQIYRRYITLNAATKEYMESSISQRIGKKKTLGLHVRGTDFHNNYWNHATVVSVEQYIDAIYEAEKTFEYEQIFVATDEVDALEKLRVAFGDRVIFYEDVLRSNDRRAVHFLPANRENHQYLMGREVLRDMLTLAECDGLIAGISNVSISTQVAKLAQGKSYEYKNIINNGFNEYGQKYLYMKSTKK